MNRYDPMHPYSTHTNRRCSYCDFRCHFKMDLTAHIKKHHKPIRYTEFHKCRYCDKHAHFITDMVKHIIDEHDGDYKYLTGWRHVPHPNQADKVKGKPTFSMNTDFTCPHCKFTGQYRVMMRHHGKDGENCKYERDSRI